MRNRLVLSALLVLGVTACQGSPSVPAPRADSELAAQAYQVQQRIRTIGTRNLPYAAIEQEIIRLTNEERQKNGLAPLRFNPIISVVARRHSEDMARRNYFAYESPEGSGPAARLRAYVNYPNSGLGENIRWVSDRAPSAVARAMMYEGSRGWMNSPDHRANILNPDFTHVAVAIARGSDGRYIATQMFISRP